MSECVRRAANRFQLHGALHRRACLAFSLALLATTPLLCVEVKVERVFLPLDATPGSFAISLPGGINFCFDPTRGGVS